MFADSNRLTETQFETKYLAEIADLKVRTEAKDYSKDDGDESYEQYSNTVVGVLTLLKLVRASRA